MSLSQMDLVFSKSKSKGLDRFVLLMIADAVPDNLGIEHAPVSLESLCAKTGLTDAELWEAIRRLSVIGELSLYKDDDKAWAKVLLKPDQKDVKL